MAPSRKGYPKRGKNVFLRLTKLISTILNISQAFSSPLVRPYSRPILQVANVQGFSSLSRLMSYGISHRCLTIVMQRMFCQRWTWRVGNSWWGTLRIPVDATVVCWFVTYCNLPKISLWRLRRFTKSQSHLQQIPPTSFILSQLCTWRIQNHQATCHRVVLSLTLHQIIPPLHPLSSPPALSKAPGLRCSQHPRRRPRWGAPPRRGCGRSKPPGAAVSNLRRRRARRRQRLAPPRGSPPPTPTAVEETAICGVKSVSFIFF